MSDKKNNDKENKSIKFVCFVLERMNTSKNKGFSAKLKKADNEATEYQAWEILAPWVNLDYESERKAYGLIGASLSRSKIKVDGNFGIGKALFFAAKENGSEDPENSSAAARLRRLLACKDSLELIGILRPIIKFLESKDINFNRAELLNQILWFYNENSRERTRAHWAQDFYGKKEKEGE